MAVSGARVTAGASAVALNTAGSGGTRLIVTSLDAAADLGGPDVASGAGFRLEAGATVTVELAPGEVLYAIEAAAAAPAELTVLRT